MTVIKNQKSNTYEVRTYYKDWTGVRKQKTKRGFKRKENVALLNVSYDMDRVVAVLGKNKVKEAIEVAKHLEQANAKQNIKKKRIDRDGR